ncbi:MAG: NAD(P)H-binding protein [Deltaproteobacteria bacterium]|nr:NAD(P)H-binding protein [Deltaproteobacteria bacterium]
MKLFVEGAHRTAGKAVAAAARVAGVEVLAQVPPGWGGEGTTPLDLSDMSALDAALDGCEAIFIEAIASLRSERDGLSQGVERALSLAEAGARAGVGRMVLLSRRGVEWIPGAVIQARRVSEAVAVESGMSWTLLRPDGLVPGEGGGALLASLRPLGADRLGRAVVALLERDLCRDRVVTGAQIVRLSQG